MPGRVRRFNDDTLEYVIALLRVVCIGTSAFVPAALLATVWFSDARWGFTMAVLVIIAVATGWLGFITWGNKSWKRSDDDLD